MAYLVDTDVLIDVAKGREGAADYLNTLDAPSPLSSSWPWLTLFFPLFDKDGNPSEL